MSNSTYEIGDKIVFQADEETTFDLKIIGIAQKLDNNGKLVTTYQLHSHGAEPIDGVPASRIVGHVGHVVNLPYEIASSREHIANEPIEEESILRHLARAFGKPDAEQAIMRNPAEVKQELCYLLNALAENRTAFHYSRVTVSDFLKYLKENRGGNDKVDIRKPRNPSSDLDDDIPD